MIGPDYWFRIITELEREMSLNVIAEKVGSSDSSLQRYKTGVVEPRYSVGQRLIALNRLAECPLAASCLHLSRERDAT